MTITATPGAEAVAVAVAEAEGSAARRRPTVGIVFAVVWLGTVVVLTVLADFLPFVRPATEAPPGAGNYAFGPGSDFWFGSDRLGRDVFSRCVYGARISLIISVTSIAVGLIIGSALGVITGYFRGWTDRTVSVFVDALLAFPAIILAALVVRRAQVLRDSDIEVLGFGFGWVSNAWAITAVFAMLSIAPITRIVRAQTLSIAQREYVLAARSIGARTPRILVREILPNIVPALVSVLFTGVAILLAAEAGLAFLGYSVQPPQASWGLMVQENRDAVETAWWATVFPCLMLFLTVLAFNLIGDRIARRFDIREAAL